MAVPRSPAVCTWVPCHHHCHEIGLSDTPAEALEYIRAAAPEGWHNVEEPLWAAFVEHAPRMLAFLEAHTPLRFAPNREPDPYAELPGAKPFGRNLSPRPLRIALLGRFGHRLRKPPRLLRRSINYEEVIDSNLYVNPRRKILPYLPRIAWRVLSGRRTMGNALVIGLLKGCLDNGCTIWPATRAQRLIRRSGRVVGVEVMQDQRPLRVDAAMGVVLASGGFEWNPEMMAEHFPGPVEWTASPNIQTGDGQRMAAEAEAMLDRMDQALIQCTSPSFHAGDNWGEPALDHLLPHSMIVNRLGQRFVNEKQINIGLAFAERDPETGLPIHAPAWRIYDRQYAAKYPHALPPPQPGVRFEVGSLEGLAGAIGVEPENLVATARRFSEFARTGVDLDFRRGESLWDRTHVVDRRHGPNPTLGTIERPPFYAMAFKPGFLATKGGARTNRNGQVLESSGDVIPGLYAAGNAMANPFGSKGIGAGTTLGPCLTWGYICGRDVVNRADG